MTTDFIGTGSGQWQTVLTSTLVLARTGDSVVVSATVSGFVANIPDEPNACLVEVRITDNGGAIAGSTRSEKAANSDSSGGNDHVCLATQAVVPGGNVGAMHTFGIQVRVDGAGAYFQVLAAGSDPTWAVTGPDGAALTIQETLAATKSA